MTNPARPTTVREVPDVGAARQARGVPMEFNYPITLTPDPDDGGFVVTFPDLPEAVTQGETVAEAWEEARGALEAALEYRVREGLEIPAPRVMKR